MGSHIPGRAQRAQVVLQMVKSRQNVLGWVSEGSVYPKCNESQCLSPSVLARGVHVQAWLEASEETCWCLLGTGVLEPREMAS